MDTTDLMSTIAQMQEELRALREQNKRLEESVSDVSMHTAPPSPRKPKIKDIQCRMFDRTEVYPSLGAGFEYFLKEYEHAIRTESLVNGSTWTDELNTSVIVNFLDGKAARYFHKKSAEWTRKHEEPMSFGALTKVLLTEYGCRLTQLELTDRLKCFKRQGDTWVDYLEYLKFIDGHMSEDQTLLLLQVFCNNSCPELAPVLLSCVDTESGNKLEQADNALALLYKLRGDGRRYAARRPQSTQEQQRPQKQRPDRQRPPQMTQNNHLESAGEGHAARGSITCFICSKDGHKMMICLLLKKRSNSLMEMHTWQQPMMKPKQ